MKQTKKDVELINSFLKAKAIADDPNASEEDLASARIALNKIYSSCTEARNKIADRLEAINLAKQQQLDIRYSNFDGEVNILVEHKEHHIVDMVGIHKDAQAIIEVKYSDKVYEQVFQPVVKASKKTVIKLAEEGVLPNASKRVKKVVVEQAKLFDFVEPSDK